MVVDFLIDNPLFPSFTPEFGFNDESVWKKASLRVLFLFPSPSSVKLDGRTPFFLYNIVKSHFGDEVFADICMGPPQFQAKVYYKECPPVVGAFSRRTWEDFDIVALSVAVTATEFAEGYRLLHKAAFPLNRSERLHDGVSPMLVLGGIAADTSSSFDSVADLVILGLGERSLVTLCDGALRLGKGKKPFALCKEQVINALKSSPGFCSPADFPYQWHITNGSVESFPVWPDELSRIEPDTMLDIESLGSSGDRQSAWPVSGNPRRVAMLTSWGCSGFGACNFCAEGASYGPWRERSMGSLLKGLFEAKKTLMGEAVAFQSFNSSYHSCFPELLLEAYLIFDHVSVLNFRLDTLASSIRGCGRDNYLRLMKDLGAVVVAGAVEGLGGRVRNGLYNKNLPFQDILTVAEEVFRLRFMKFKTGYIVSGHENGSDLREGIGEIKKIAALKRSMYGVTQYVLSVSKLVHHFGTPVYRLPRVASWLNWRETFGDPVAYFPFADLAGEGVSVRSVSGMGFTFIQQLHHDLPSDLSREALLDPALSNPVETVGKVFK